MGPVTTALQPHSMRFDEDTIAYFTAGQSAGMTFVFIHGIGMSTAYYKSLITLLAPHFRILSVDLPGFGASSRPDKAWTINHFADAVGDVIEHENILHPILVGQSMGCQVVAALLAQRPYLSPKAILISPTVESKKRNALSHFRKLVQDSYHEPPRANFTVWRDYFRCGPRQYFKTLGPMLKDRIEDNLAASEAAIMIIRGGNDIIVPKAWTSKLAAHATAAARCEIQGAPHLVHMTHTKEVAAICEKFALA
jgi:pimeloyl-ACP methyl ester carboxylesterase